MLIRDKPIRANSETGSSIEFYTVKGIEGSFSLYTRRLREINSVKRVITDGPIKVGSVVSNQSIAVGDVSGKIVIADGYDSVTLYPTPEGIIDFSTVADNADPRATGVTVEAIQGYVNYSKQNKGSGPSTPFDSVPLRTTTPIDRSTYLIGASKDARVTVNADGERFTFAVPRDGFISVEQGIEQSGNDLAIRGVTIRSSSESESKRSLWPVWIVVALIALCVVAYMFYTSSIIAKAAVQNVS